MIQDLIVPCADWVQPVDSNIRLNNRSNPALSTTTHDTRERLLDTAERLFAEQGIDATSLRHITAEAHANLASVNYHFGTKEELVRELFARRIGPINHERLDQLDACKARGDTSLECVLRAFLGPALRLRLDANHGGEHFTCLLGRLYSEPTELKMVVIDEFKVVLARFNAALQRALPDLAHEELTWRFFFTIGSMAHLMSAGDLLNTLTQGRCDPSDVEGTLQRVIDFSAAGFRAISRGDTP